MKHKIIICATILFLLSGLFATVAAKALFDIRTPKTPTFQIAIPVTATPEEVSRADATVQATEEVTEMTEITTPAPAITETHTPPQSVEVTEGTESMEQVASTISIASASTEPTLFIGDSRTVGLSEYAEIDGADFFASVGAGVFNIEKVILSVAPDRETETLSEVLQQQQYAKIYIMLGINELGYPFEMLVQRYHKFIQSVQSLQPDSMIFVLANLHVTQSRSDTDAFINNATINTFNEAISALADNQHIFYLDANCIFDDANGALDAKKSEDSAHLYAKYYQEWGNWIAEQTGIILSQLKRGAES